jgi:hypothetical protein
MKSMPWPGSWLSRSHLAHLSARAHHAGLPRIRRHHPGITRLWEHCHLAMSGVYALVMADIAIENGHL